MFMEKNGVRRIAILGLMGALLIASQVALAFLPNIEIVSLLLIIMTIHLGKLTLAPLYVFVLVEGLLYGISMWWLNYTYVWLVLFLVAYLFRRQQRPLFWAALSAIFGLCFGALCAIPYLFIGGIPSAFAYWLSGLPFDAVHCIGNFAVALALFRPLNRLAEKTLAHV